MRHGGEVHRYIGDEVVVTERVRHRVGMGEMPLPARHLLPNDRYYSITSQLQNFTVMLTSMGCHQSCTFCAIAPLVQSTRSPAR